MNTSPDFRKPAEPSGYSIRPESDTVLLRANNSRWLSQILGSQRAGYTCLPFFLGLAPADFQKILQELLPEHAPHRVSADSGQRDEQAPCNNRLDLRQQLLEMRREEWDEIRMLLCANRAGQDDCEVLMADIVAAGCLGGDHLWRDLGLQSRAELSALMMQNFTGLALANSGDMKWKKFFYKQLCEQGGGYVCRAPSCDQCSAYNDCFGPEE